MTLYAPEISTATGNTDPAVLALVEDIMRTNFIALDQLSADEFAFLASFALFTAQVMSALGLLKPYCEAFGLAIPTEI